MPSLRHAFVTLLLIAAPLRAAEMQVEVVLADDWMRTFEHRMPARPGDAAELPRATIADLQPYIEEAKKALASHRGYTPRFFGDVHHRISPTTRLFEVRVVDGDGRLLNRVRRGRRPRRAEAKSPFPDTPLASRR